MHWATKLNISFFSFWAIVLTLFLSWHTLSWTADYFWEYHVEYEEVEVLVVDRGEAKQNTDGHTYMDNPRMWVLSDRKDEPLKLSFDYWMLYNYNTGHSNMYAALSKGDVIEIRWNVYSRASCNEDWKFHSIIELVVNV
jgi:hypothetical protein